MNPRLGQRTAPSPRTPARSLRAIPPPALFVASALSQYLGAAVAVLLFRLVAPLAVAWLRVSAAAAVLLVVRRPWRHSGGRAGRRAAATSRRRRRVLIAAFGIVLTSMNVAFYLALARLPLGTAVAIEFLGPVGVAAAGTRSRRDAGALVVALMGITLLAEVRAGGEALGFACALAAAGLWALYIVLGARVAATGSGVDGLAAGLGIGALAYLPLALVPAAPVLASPPLLAACLLVGLLSSVVPYGIDQVVLARIGTGHFSLLLALLPATAAVIGAVVLGQLPTPLEALGIALVVAAVALRSPA